MNCIFEYDDTFVYFDGHNNLCKGFTNEVTNLRALIIPSSIDSKILVTVTGSLSADLYSTVYATIYRNDKDLSNNKHFAVIHNATHTNAENITMQFLDEPRTDKPLIYTVRVGSDFLYQSAYWNANLSRCTMTLLEFA